jgi:hypothetical protein
MDEANLPQTERPLRLKVCPRCDYSLTGLPAVSTCPECGRPYDQLGVYLYGDAAGTRLRPWSSRPQKRRYLLWRVLLFLPICCLLLWHRSWHQMRFFSFFQLTQFMIPFAIILWRSLSDSGSGVVQVKLTPDGVLQGVRGLGPIPYEKIDDGKLIPWEKIKSVRLKPLKNEQASIRLTSSNSWWQLTREYVNANVRCTSAELDALIERIAQWRSAAGCASTF